MSSFAAAFSALRPPFDFNSASFFCCASNALLCALNRSSAPLRKFHTSPLCVVIFFWKWSKCSKSVAHDATKSALCVTKSVAVFAHAGDER